MERFSCRFVDHFIYICIYERVRTDLNYISVSRLFLYASFAQWIGGVTPNVAMVET